MRLGLGAAVLVWAASCATPPTTTKTTHQAAASDPEVILLRERVARLEKRLVEVDGKLALLLARADAPSTLPSTAAPSMTAPASMGAVSSPLPGRRGERTSLPPVPEGLASIDIGRGGDSDAIVSIDEGGIVELAPQGDIEPGESIASTLTVSSLPPADKVSDEASDDASGESSVVLVGQGDDLLAAMQSARELYAWAQARLKEARYLEAVAAFEEIALRFPKDDLVDNSLYWIGVCHQGRGEHRLAIAEWQKLPARFPKSPKIPDALFGMAQSHEALGEPAVAEVLYDEVVGSYPKAEKYKEAKKAIARLRPPTPGPR